MNALATLCIPLSATVFAPRLSQELAARSSALCCIDPPGVVKMHTPAMRPRHREQGFGLGEWF